MAKVTRVPFNSPEADQIRGSLDLRIGFGQGQSQALETSEEQAAPTSETPAASVPPTYQPGDYQPPASLASSNEEPLP